MKLIALLIGLYFDFSLFPHYYPLHRVISQNKAILPQYTFVLPQNTPFLPQNTTFTMSVSHQNEFLSSVAFFMPFNSCFQVNSGNFMFISTIIIFCHFSLPFLAQMVKISRQKSHGNNNILLFYHIRQKIYLAPIPATKEYGFSFLFLLLYRQENKAECKDFLLLYWKENRKH